MNYLKTTEGVIRTWSELTEQVRNALSYVSGYKKNMNGCLQNWLNWKYYLNSVNSNLIKSDIKVRFFYSNLQPFDSEFYDDIRSYLQKS